MELRDVLVILDDKKARRIAQQMGLRVIGTIGVLLRAKQQGLLAEIRPFIDVLQQADFRISDSLYEEALRLAGEADGNRP